MELRIAKSYLSQGIQIVSKAVPSKTTMSILECILIDASGNEIRLIANDMELGIETIVPGLIIDRGIIAVDAQIFSNIVRKLPDNDVVIATEGEKITITCEKAKFTILGKDGTDFAYLPEIEKKSEVKISQYMLRDLINRTIFSISGNESSGMMTGELMEIRDNRLRMVALDGHRIAIRNVELMNSYEDRKVIVPGKTLGEISKILSGDTDKFVSIYFTDKHALFAFDDTIVVTRLIEGDYYRIDKMLSSSYQTRVTVQRKELLSCIDRATLLVKEEDKKPVIIMIDQYDAGKHGRSHRDHEGRRGYEHRLQSQVPDRRVKGNRERGDHALSGKPQGSLLYKGYRGCLLLSDPSRQLHYDRLMMRRSMMRRLRMEKWNLRSEMNS